MAEDTNVATIPKVLHQHINSAFPVHVCLVGVVLPNGFAQVSPRGSTMVFDDEHFAIWERGKGTTNANLKDGTKLTVFFKKNRNYARAYCRRAASRVSMGPRRCTSPGQYTSSVSGRFSRRRRSSHEGDGWSTVHRR